MTATETAFDTRALRRGIEERDASTLLGLYSDGAELHVVDRSNPPSVPRILTGRAAISEYLDEVASRDMTHALERVVASGSTAAYIENCRYPDGTRVLCLAVLDLADGRIVRQVGVQAWDESSS